MSDCKLSPTADAFSTFLTAFVGSIVNGFCNGALIAFFTGWIAWLAAIRVVVAAVLEYRQTVQAGTTPFQHEPLLGDQSSTQEQLQIEEQELSKEHPPPYQLLNLQQSPVKQGWINGGLDREVKITGWIGWTWSALYTPTSQTIWVVSNFSSNNGAIKLARAIAIGVSALGLTYDNKQRYGASLGRRWGSWAFVTFNVWNATACLLLGVECVLLLVTGARQLQLGWYIYVVFVFFSSVWAAASFRILPIVDGSRRSVNVFVDILIGALAGVFVAAPALVLWQNAKFDADTAQMLGNPSPDGLSLGAYLSCEGASILDKFAAIMP